MKRSGSRKQTVLAAQAGKHIIIEKPVAIHWKDMKRMKEAVDKAGATTIVGFVLRWNPLFLHAITPEYKCYPWSVKKETAGRSCRWAAATRWTACAGS